MVMRDFNDSERVRDHLANERTYLAWLRTGMAMMGFGVVIAKLRYLLMATTAVPATESLVHATDIGFLFAAIGLVIVMTSGWRYAVIQDQIRKQDYHSSKRIVAILSGTVIVLGFLILWYLVQDILPNH